MAILKLKSLDEIVTTCRELIHRYRRRWLKKNTRPCPINCQSAILVGKSRVIGCEGCGSRNIEQCDNAKKFTPIYSKEELHNQFRERIRNPEILLRDYRDIAILLWAVGGFDEDIDEKVIAGFEQRTPDPTSPAGGTGPQSSPDPGNTKPGRDDSKPAANNPGSLPGQRGAGKVQGAGK